MSTRAAEIAALKLEIIPVRYFRNIASLGIAGQARLLSSSVAVVGAGGLGGLAIELLSRLGVGKITIIDGDRFSEDNLNRQVLCREDDIDRLKAEVGAQRVRAINSAIEVVFHPIFLTEENAVELLSKSQVVVDALDRISIRIVLEKVIGELGIPMVHGAIGGFLGQVATIMPGSNILSALYGGDAAPSARGIEALLGTPTVTPAVIASLEVMEVIKFLLDRGTPLKDEFLYLELENAIFSRIDLQR
ncbi:MAG TPA: HesA/MoeB/ThiF family protein [Proteobacteria bacterium]|nr:HesA/MoeB/ThiF family protein [Pseudomonadota bacterium]